MVGGEDDRRAVEKSAGAQVVHQAAEARVVLGDLAVVERQRIAPPGRRLLCRQRRELLAAEAAGRRDVDAGGEAAAVGLLRPVRIVRIEGVDDEEERALRRGAPVEPGGRRAMHLRGIDAPALPSPELVHVLEAVETAAETELLDHRRVGGEHRGFVARRGETLGERAHFGRDPLVASLRAVRDRVGP